MILNNATVAMLTQSYNAAFKRGFAGFGVDQDWSKVASQEISTTSTGVYPYLGHFAKMRVWSGDRQVKNFQEYVYTLKNQRFESTEEVKVVDIEDDQYGVYATAFENAGASVKVWPDDLVFGGDPIYGGAAVNGATGLCYDGQPFFNANHPMHGGVASNYDATPGVNQNLWMLIDNTKPIMPFIFQLRSAPKITPRMNDQDPAVFDRDVFTWGIRARGAAGYGYWQLAYGSLNDMTEANFRTYRSTMRAFVSDEGFKLGVRPTLLVCGPSREAEARDLLKRQLIPVVGGGAASNAEFEAVDLLVTPHLT